MKKKSLGVLVASLLVTIFGVAEASAQQNDSMSVRIKHYYAKEQMRIENTSHPLSGYELIAWNYTTPNIPTRYDLWNITTGERFGLPTGIHFVKLLHVNSDTDVQFLATGANDVYPHVSFPFLIDCARGDAKSQFQEFDQPYYLGLNQSATFGDAKIAAVSDVRLTMDGIQVSFEAENGKTNSFYAGATGIPTTITSYNQSGNEFTIVFKNSEIHWQGNAGGNLFIKNVVLRRTGENTELILRLTNRAKYYLANEYWIAANNDQPYVNFVFNSEKPQVKPGYYYGE